MSMERWLQPIHVGVAGAWARPSCLWTQAALVIHGLVLL